MLKNRKRKLVYQKDLVNINKYLYKEEIVMKTGKELLIAKEGLDNATKWINIVKDIIMTENMVEKLNVDENEQKVVNE